MPPFVFLGRGTSYQIFGVKRRPRNVHERLHHTPCPKVHDHSGICPGNTPFLTCSPQTIEAALTLFLEGSYFNGDLSRGKGRRYPDDVRRLWVELEGGKHFPLSELVRSGKVLWDLL